MAVYLQQINMEDILVYKFMHANTCVLLILLSFYLIKFFDTEGLVAICDISLYDRMFNLTMYTNKQYTTTDI